jgi:hypothetical protein
MNSGNGSINSVSGTHRGYRFCSENTHELNSPYPRDADFGSEDNSGLCTASS